MKFKYLLLLLCVAFHACIGVGSDTTYSIDTDSLKKYSYLVVGITYEDGNPGLYPAGTGFFIRADEDLYFITTKHTISGFSPFTKKPLLQQFDTIGIRYFDNVSGKPRIIKIGFHEIKKKISNKYFFEIPDQIMFKITGGAPSDSKLYSLEGFIDSSQSKISKPDQIIMYGYEAEKQNIATFTFEGITVTSFTGTFADEKHKNPDIPSNDSLNWVLEPRSFDGMDGAPVFFLYSKMQNGNPVARIIFGGMAVGNDSIYKSTYILRPDASVNEMKQTSIFKP